MGTELSKIKMADLPHILVVDDDDRIRALVSRYLNQHDFVAVTAAEAQAARAAMARLTFDALVVDVMMPGQSGLEFVRALRDEGQDMPVLLLTALGEAEDRISGFESGADDYLPKPFEPRELLLRLQALLRRRPSVSSQDKGFYVGPWYYDSELNELQGKETSLRLTEVEGNLLRALAEKPGEVVSRDELAAEFDVDAGARTIDVQVTRLRRKLEDDAKAPRYLQTVRGKGYLLRTEGA